MSGPISAIPVPGLGEIEPGARLGELIAAAAELRAGEIVVISQKVVSKAEGRLVDLATVEPSAGAVELAAEVGKQPELVELILRESRRVVRAERGRLIVETDGGLICANAGIDASNVGGGERVALLPADPDASARRIRAEIEERVGARPAVLISDSFGRPWRLGQSEVAIGCAGIDPLDDWRGRRDRDGRELAATVIAFADQLAAAADLARTKVDGTPVVLLRGLEDRVIDEHGPGAIALLRAPEDDLFR
jgi:coenzyme F420-0:L-glutamate ligase/coenzyme F420-1:gamma-L-glutamate ligase